MLPRPARVGAGGDARRARARRARRLPARPDRAAARRGGARARPRARRQLRGHRHRGRPGRAVAGAAGRDRPRRRGHPRRSRLLPPARRRPRGRRRARARCAIGPESGYRLDPDAVAAAITPRTRAICLVDPSNPYGTLAADDEVAALTALAERHGLLLIHDVTHGAARHRARRAAGGRAAPASTRWRRSRSRTASGMAGRAHGLPGRAAGPHARLPAAQGGAHAAEHEPGVPARRAGGPARPRLPRQRRDGDPRQSRPPRADAGRDRRPRRSPWRLVAAWRARSSSTTRGRRRRS